MEVTDLRRSTRHAACFVTVFLAFSVCFSQGATITVNIVGDSFVPNSITINLGDTVTWSGLDNEHNVTGSAASDMDQFCGSSPTSYPTETSCSRTFNIAGEFPYECTIHINH